MRVCCLPGRVKPEAEDSETRRSGGRSRDGRQCRPAPGVEWLRPRFFWRAACGGRRNRLTHREFEPAHPRRLPWAHSLDSAAARDRDRNSAVRRLRVSSSLVRGKRKNDAPPPAGWGVLEASADLFDVLPWAARGLAPTSRWGTSTSSSRHASPGSGAILPERCLGSVHLQIDGIEYSTRDYTTASRGCPETPASVCGRDRRRCSRRASRAAEAG